MTVLAQGPFEYLNAIPDTGGGDYDLTAILTLGLNIAVGIGVAFATIFIVIGGIKYITSSGDPKAVDSARKTLTYSVFAFILVMFVFALRFLILKVIGVEGDVFYNEVPDLE